MAKFNKKHRCIENVMKSNHKGKLKLDINIRSRSLMSEAKENVASHTKPYIIVHWKSSNYSQRNWKKMFLLHAYFKGFLAEVESLRTHFEVLGVKGQVLGLEASSPRKLACPRLEDSTIFWIVKILWNAWKIFWKTFFCGDRLKNFCEDLFFLGEHLRLCPWSLALASSIPVLGLESVCPRKGCPWPRIFFVSLALASSLVSSTSPLLLGFNLFLNLNFLLCFFSFRGILVTNYLQERKSNVCRYHYAIYAEFLQKILWKSCHETYSLKRNYLNQYVCKP